MRGIASCVVRAKRCRAPRTCLRLSVLPRNRAIDAPSQHGAAAHQCRHLSSKSRTNRIFVSTTVAEPFSVPLTLTDVHLRHEQLPFAYAFRATLDSDKLVSSLREVLRRYPILGGTVDFSSGKVPTLECNVEDTVPMSFGRSEFTLDQWLTQERSGQMQHNSWQSGGGSPILSPLFDDLSPAKWEDLGNDDIAASTCIDAKENVATVRVTHFRGGGTGIGINITHLLGDANSCFRICQVWGRAMRGLVHPIGASNARAEATLTGMVTPEMAELLNLTAQGSSGADRSAGNMPFYSVITSYFNEFIDSKTADSKTEVQTIDVGEYCIAGHSDDSHEYVRLEFSSELLQAMKTYGMSHCNLQPTPSVLSSSISGYGSCTDELCNFTPFVSTNDMITAMGWMIKRHIAGKSEWNLSMVVNLRSRGGINDFGCLEDPSIGVGVFGNALTNIVAKLPPSTNRDISMPEVGDAAVAIRQSLTKKMADIQGLQTLSRSGRAFQASDQGYCFSSTSWMQFPLWDISFRDDGDGQQSGCLDGFYGRPSYPLPTGDTYSSIIVPSRCGGCTYKLLAPTRHVQSILTLHQNISTQFLAWAREQKS